MTVFKACMKILKSNWLILVIYFLIFTIISFSLSTSAKENAEKAYEKTDVKVSVINNDDSEYADSLIKYLDNNAKLVDIVENEEGISDALFYRYTEYVIKIDEDFGEKMAAGEAVSLDKYEVSGSYSGVFMDSMINEYVAKMRVYGPDVPESTETQVSIQGEEKEENMAVYMYDFSAYSITAIIILGIGALLSTFNKEDIRKRNLVSPVSGIKIALSQLLSSLLFTIFVWIMTAVSSAFVIGIEYIGTAELLMTGNMLLYSLVCLSMGFCISTMVKSANGRNITANVVSLGFSFIGGVMIPVSMMSDTVKILGSFTPTYWFTNANELLSKATSFSVEKLGGVWQSMGIQVLFIVAFLAIGLAALRRKTT